MFLGKKSPFWRSCKAKCEFVQFYITILYYFHPENIKIIFLLQSSNSYWFYAFVRLFYMQQTNFVNIYMIFKKYFLIYWFLIEILFQENKMAQISSKLLLNVI